MDRYLKVSMDDLNRVKKYLELEHLINVTVETPAKTAAKPKTPTPTRASVPTTDRSQK
jgi:hypothetical protein